MAIRCTSLYKALLKCNLDDYGISIDLVERNEYDMTLLIHGDNKSLLCKLLDSDLMENNVILINQFNHMVAQLKVIKQSQLTEFLIFLW